MTQLQPFTAPLDPDDFVSISVNRNSVDVVYDKTISMTQPFRMTVHEGAALSIDMFPRSRDIGANGFILDINPNYRSVLSDRTRTHISGCGYDDRMLYLTEYELQRLLELRAISIIRQ